MSHLPNDIKKQIDKYLDLSYQVTKNNIKKCSLDKMCYYLCFHPEKKPYFKQLKALSDIIHKYNTYQCDYEKYCMYSNNVLNKDYQNLYDNPGYYWLRYKRSTFSPVLIDILCSGLNIPYAYSTFKEFHSFMIDDIKTILKICPSSVLSDWGCLRCRYNVDPLYIACINSNIPSSIIKLLIKHGADVKYEIKFNNDTIHILEDMNLCRVHKSRIDEITNIFNKSYIKYMQ